MSVFGMQSHFLTETKKMRFTVLQDFYSAETQSQYVSGMSYTVSPADVRLHKLVARWIAEGKIVEGGPEAKVSGKD